MKYFYGKRVFITGGSSGIGLEMARIIVRFGADIVLFARDKEKLKTVKGELFGSRSREDQKIEIVSMDIAKWNDVSKKIETAIKSYGIPDIAINSAGIAGSYLFEKTSYEKFDEIIKINLYGTRNFIASLIPHMKGGDRHMVLLSSLAGLIGPIGYSAYSASKYGIVGMAECVRPELKMNGIRLSLVCPGEVDTPLLREERKNIPPAALAVKTMAGTLPVKDAAHAIVRGIGKKRYMIIPGARARFTYLLQSFFPAWLSRFSVDLVISFASRRG